jgi:hypothetical protein
MTAGSAGTIDAMIAGIVAMTDAMIVGIAGMTDAMIVGIITGGIIPMRVSKWKKATAMG